MCVCVCVCGVQLKLVTADYSGRPLLDSALRACSSYGAAITTPASSPRSTSAELRNDRPTINSTPITGSLLTCLACVLVCTNVCSHSETFRPITELSEMLKKRVFLSVYCVPVTCQGTGRCTGTRTRRSSARKYRISTFSTDVHR